MAKLGEEAEEPPRKRGPYKRRFVQDFASRRRFRLRSNATYAADFAAPMPRRFGVQEITNVAGEFEFCKRDRRIPLNDGYAFVCAGYSQHYAYAPEVLILRNVQ